MDVKRRTLLQTVLSAIAGVGSGIGVAQAQTAPGRSRVAYHLADAERVEFVLGNIRNHLDGMGGPEKIEIILVIHGPALKAFHDLSAGDKVREVISKLTKDRVGLHACANTMRGQGVKVTDLLPGFVSADQGGVVRLAELQAQGYAYIRP